MMENNSFNEDFTSDKSKFYVKKGNKFDQLNWLINRLSDNSREQILLDREFLVVLKEAVLECSKKVQALERRVADLER